MSDFDIFTSALSKYINDSQNCDNTSRHNLYLSFARQILNLSCNDFRLYYHKAYFYNQQNSIQEAKINIDKAIGLIPYIKDNGIIYVENGRNLYGRNENGLVYCICLNLNSQLADLYLCAGEIYAKNSIYEESLSFYKKAQYYLSFLKADFEESTVYVYSFRRLNEHSLEDLINNQITVSPSYMMNDPFDSVINLWAEEEHFKNTCKDESHAKTYAQSFKYYRIRSFAYGEEKSILNNTLMWAHYGNEHKGFCIKYKLSSNFIKQLPNEKFEHMYLKKIEYKDSVIDIEVPTIDSNLAFATKNKKWAYENEVRLIVYNPNKPQPFYGISLDSESHIDSIYFGYRCSDKDKDKIKKALKHNISTPTFWEIKLNKHDIYNMNITKY